MKYSGNINKIFLIIANLMGLTSPAWSAQMTDHDVKHDVSPPLKVLAAMHQPIQLGTPEPLHFSSFFPVTLEGFQGLGQGFGNYVVTAPQPDISGGAGINQYVEWVNNDIGVFDKQTGALASGFPMSGKTIWSGFGSECEASTLGNPIVKYDQLAHRWVLSQYAYNDANNGPFYQCVAVSTSEDATGTYNRYAFIMDAFNNYGRLGLWPDAYYMSFEMSGSAAMGTQICGLDRNSMLTGNTAGIFCHQFLTTESGGLLPADLDGTALPPTGTPGYFIGLDAPNNLVLYKMHVDFTNIANSNIMGPLSIPVYAFTKACPTTDGGSCVVQPGVSNKLDILVDRLVRRVSYRQFGDHASMVMNHVIQGPPPKYAPAIRWYELRFLDNNQNPVVFQQSTLAPNSMNRFDGSMAIDKSGNIAIGYTVSSSMVFPSPEMAARNYYDPLNTLTIQPLFTGTGSQTDISNWGRYSIMSIDPVDNCTFWYSSEYLKSNGSYNWSTFIVHFKLAACS